MENKEKIYKIVQIVDQSTFIINGGSEQNIKEKDKFIIIGNKTNSIIDPDSGDIIETLPTNKAEIFAKTVYEKVSICTTKWVSPYHSAGMPTGTAAVQAMQKSFFGFNEHDVPGHYKELGIKEEESKPLDDHDDTPVALGDKVKKVQ